MVSTKLVISRASALDDPGGPPALKVMRAILTRPVGDERLERLPAEIEVLPLANSDGLANGEPENSAVVPPATEAIVTTV